MITLLDAEGSAVAANESGSYTVTTGASYTWTAAAEGYVSESGSFTADTNRVITVTLKEKAASPDPANTVTITFVGENGYAKYQGEKVTSIQVDPSESFVEFAIYGNFDEGYETDTVTASSGKLNRAGDVCILSDFTEDVTVTFTTCYRTLYITYSITNYNNSWIVSPQAVTWGQVADRPTILRTGYHVDTWYTDEAKTQEYGFDTPVTEDFTLYGDWARDVYTITYMVDGNVYATAQAEYGGRIKNAPANPTKDNYIFDGWYFDEEYTQPFDNPQFYGDDILYAKWVEAKMNYVYLDGTNGSDENSGMTSSDAVKTFAKAKELLAEAAYKEIRICDKVNVSTDEVWDLSEYPGAVVIRDESFDDGAAYLVWMTGGSLTLKNIVVDGGGTRWTNNKGYMAFYVKNSTLILDSGAELCNHIGTSSSGVIYGYQGGKIVMNAGASIHDNQGNYSGAIELGYGSSFEMNGGEIYNNTAVYAKGTSATTSSVPSGVARINGSSSYGNSTFTLNDGKIYNNSVADTGSTYGSGVFHVYNRGDVVIKGGEITGNTGISAAVLTSAGTMASTKSTENFITITGGTFANNTARTTDRQIDLRSYSNLVLSGNSFDGTIWMCKSTANRRPVQLTAALTKPLNLAVEEIVFSEELVSGTEDYALTESDLSFIEAGLVNELDEHFVLTLDAERNLIYVGSSQVIGAQIWLSPNGNDANDGLTKDTAVATFERAKALLAANASETADNIITMVANTGSTNAKCFVLREDATWSLAGIPNASIQAESNSTTSGYLVELLGCTLTLENIIIDGNNFYQANGKNISGIRFEPVTDPDTDELIRGGLILNSGAILRNFNDNAVYAYGGYLEVNEGAVITGCTKDYAIYSTGAVKADGSDNSTTIVINGGTLSNNAYRVFNLLGDTKLTINGGLFEDNAAGTGNPGGAVIYANAKNTQTVINGGVFRGNVVDGTAANSVGAVFYTTSACKLTINGGTFQNNVCVNEPNAIVAINGSAASSLAVVTVGPAADLTNVPFFFKVADSAGALQITGALTSTLSLTYAAAPAAGTVVAQGAADYTLTEADLARVTCTNEGVVLTLDTANNCIVVAPAAE